jgi:hypothetical protein
MLMLIATDTENIQAKPAIEVHGKTIHKKTR